MLELDSMAAASHRAEDGNVCLLALVAINCGDLHRLGVKHAPAAHISQVACPTLKSLKKDLALRN